MISHISLEAIIVWQGAITRYGIIAELPHDIEDVRMATQEEVKRYKSVQ